MSFELLARCSKTNHAPANQSVELYDSGFMSNGSRPRELRLWTPSPSHAQVEQAHWEAEEAAGLLDSSGWPTLNYTKCLDGFPESIPGSADHKFKCKNVCSYVLCAIQGNLKWLTSCQLLALTQPTPLFSSTTTRTSVVTSTRLSPRRSYNVAVNRMSSTALLLDCSIATEAKLPAFTS